jgi:isoquinoline 1-oxidoreductase beta subunit
LRLWAHAVTVHTPLVGGGFGRRLEVDYGVTAARIAKQFDVPVKAIWSREEDCTQGRFRPMSSALLQATLASDGAIQQLTSHVASTDERPRTGSLQQMPYAITNCSTQYTRVPSSIRIGSWRSVDSSQNIFFRECFIDECAQAAGADPLAYRLKLLSHNTRAQRVLEKVSALSAWNRKDARYLGVAFCEGFGSLSAQVVEVIRTAEKTFKVAKIFIVVDCGTAIDPDNISAQLQGAALFGLSAALHEEVTYLDGTLQQRNFDAYPVLRIAEAPEIVVEIIETPDAEIGGMGEVGVPPLAPALLNALFVATGTRIRKLPLTHANLQWATRA